MNSNVFDEDYFENGIATGKSCYTNFRWLPEMTIRFAHKIIKALDLRDGEKLLDFGCAKGFMVKAFRLLDIDAYGCDISDYAVTNADHSVKDYVKKITNGIPFDIHFDWTLSKDVFEHLTEAQLDNVLPSIHKVSDKLFVIVPAYELDKTHKLAKSVAWWEKKFEDNGWRVDRFSYLISGMKENWADYKKGNGFFILVKYDK